MHTKKRINQINPIFVLPRGFRASGIHSGIKRRGKDIALIVSEKPAAIAGTFTSNQIQAAHIQLCKERLKSRSARAIIVNSGNANTCTGAQGKADAIAMARITAKCLHVQQRTVFVCSTGVIGVRLPIAIVERGIVLAVKNLSKIGGSDAAMAILTTDTKPKWIVRRINIGKKLITISGIAKGAGMISPHMATLLVFLATDAAVQPDALQSCLSASIKQSFNQITIDGEQSPNDTALFMANGMAGNTPITARHPGWKTFCNVVNDLTYQLALMIVADAEGATKFVTVTVKGTPGRNAAEKIARAVATSPLVKTSWFGAEPNWGRVISAIGSAGVRIKQNCIDITYNNKKFVSGGKATNLSSAVLGKIVRKKAFSIGINLHLGKACYTLHTCDYSEKYVHINSSYMT